MARPIDRPPLLRPGWTAVASTASLHGDGPHAVSAAGLDLVVVRTPAGLRAFEGHCPHQGALLAEGSLDDGVLECRNHRWRFDAATGRRIDGPERLTSCPAVERDGQVLADLTELLAPAPSAPKTLRRVDQLPGPAGLPLVGNLLQLELARLHQILEAWVPEYGPIYRYRLGPRPIVAIADPRLSEQVLRARPDTYRRLDNIEPVFAELGLTSLFSSEGAAWRPQRRLAMGALSPRHLRDFGPTLQTITTRLERRWREAARSGEPVDIVDDLKRFTVDVTTRLTLGHDVNTIEGGDDVIQRRLELVFPALNRRLFALIPTWRVVRTRADRQLDRALAEVRRWLQGLIDAAREAGPNTAGADARPATFLEAMVTARDESGRPFPDDVISGNLLGMLLAGEDTTAYTLGWAVHHLCDSPASVEAVRREVDAVLGASPLPVDAAAAHRLVFTSAVAQEAMRLRPVAPLLFHVANADTALGDVHLPAGTCVVVLTRPPALDPDHFEQPQAFRPARWLAAAGAHDPSAHMPFGSGPRLCPGRSLALVEMQVVLAMLYRNFDVERHGPADAVRERFAFTMSPEGLSVRLHARS